ncbi:MAG: hypothetical protein ACI4F5_08870 [Acutalibacteraceae bacterium]
MEYSQTPVIVVARNFSTALGVVRSLGEKGHSVYFVGGAYKKGALVYASVSKYIKKFNEIVSYEADKNHERELLNAILSYGEKLPRKTVVFPTDDFTAEMVEKNRAILSKYFLLPHTEDGSDYSIDRLMDKSVQHTLAQKSGLHTPEEWYIDFDAAGLPPDIIYPCICKPLKSNAGHKDEIKVCADSEQLTEHTEYLRSLGKKGSVLVQQYLKVDYEIDMSGVCVNQKIILPGVIYKHYVSQQQNGVTIAGELCKTDLIGENIEKVKAFLQSLHLTGMIDLELMVCGEKLYFNEVNLRCGGPGYSYTAGGVNLPHIFVNALYGNAPDEKEDKMLSFGKRFLYEKVAWEDYFSGYLSYSALNKLEKNADIFLLKNKRDPLPYLLFSGRKSLQKVKKCLKSPKKEALFLIERAYCGYMEHRLKKPKKSNGTLSIIVGNNYNVNYAVARSLGEAGYPVKVIQLFDTNIIHTLMRHFVLPQPSAFSRFVQDYSVCVLGKDKESAEDKLIKYLSSFGSVNNPPCLIPTDDKTVCMIDNNYEKLSPSFFLPGAGRKSGGLVQLMDKSVQSKLARQAGLNVPQEWVIETTENPVLPDDMIYPCICKPLKSAAGSKAEIKICADSDTLFRHLTDLYKGGTQSVLVQQFISSDYEIDMSGVCMNDKVLLPGIIKKTDVSKASVGVTTSGVICSAELPDSTTDKIKSFLRNMNFQGVFDLECLVSDNKVYFIEVNFRTGAPIYSYPAAGVNLPKILVDSLKNKTAAFNGDEMTQTGLSLVSERSLLEEFKNKNMSFKKALSIINNSDVCFIKNKNDKRPYRKFLPFFATNLLLRLIKK